MLKVFLIGGWGSNEQCWNEVINEFTSSGYDLEIIDWQDALLNNEIAKKISEHPSKALLCGWSLGGMLALKTATEHQNKILGMVLISSCAKFCSEGEYQASEPKGLRAMKLKLRKSPQEVLQDFTTTCFSPEKDQNSIDNYQQQCQSCKPEALKAGLDFLMKEDLREFIPELDIPTRILHGKRDAITPHRCSEYLEQHLPQATLLTLNHSGHSLPISAPLECAGVIRTFTEEMVD